MHVRGPWSLDRSRVFWEGFAPAALRCSTDPPGRLATRFRVDADWSAASAEVRQDGPVAAITVRGPGDLEAAAAQVARFLALDVDATDWPAVGRRDPVVGALVRESPGLRPCGFHSPYEAAAWAVLSQRIRIVQAARLRDDLVRAHGTDGAFPAPAVLRGLELDLPGRKPQYLRAVADAAIEGRLDGGRLRSLAPETAMREVQGIRGIGPFAAGLVVVRGANAPDALPLGERRLEAEVVERYGPTATLEEVSRAWRPFRTWAAVHLRTARERRTGEIGGRRPAA